MGLHRRIPETPPLGCTVAKRFALHPRLSDIAGDLLAQQWQARQLSSEHDPLELFLVTTRPGPREPWIRPLKEVLIERFCKGRTLNLTPGEDHLSTRQESAAQWVVDVDLHAVERLINDCGPWVIESYQDALVLFWSSAGRDGQSPWQWYAQYLQEQLQVTITRGIDDLSLTQPAAALARLVQAYPWREQRAHWSNSSSVRVYNLKVDLSASWQMDPNLASALLIEPAETAATSSPVLLYTLTGRLFSFSSRQELLQFIGNHWPQRLAGLQPQVQLWEPDAQAFEIQALGVLDQHLRLIESASATYVRQRRATALGQALNRLTSMFALCNASERERYRQLFASLPDWLRAAPASQHVRYADMLAGIAEANQCAQGDGWLHGIASAETFAREQLARRIEIDHPHAHLDLSDLCVVNYQVTPAALPGQGAFVLDNSVREIRFSLAQLAIANLGLLQPGRVAVESRTGRVIPSWFDERYLSTLVTEVDIGASYPRELQQRLLDDPAEVARRQRLLIAQLRAQLPAQALELHLRNRGVSLKGVEAVTLALSPEPPADPPHWSLRALAFKRRAGAASDFPRNAWLIEHTCSNSQPCLLYRPLHPEPLLEFIDRSALFTAISTPGPLQDDMLQRLPAPARRVYAYGGFLEPHLFFPLEDTWAVPFGHPAPVLIDRQPEVPDLGEALYRACVEETIDHFREHSMSSEQTRWQRWQELGWLLLNTVLPFADGSIARAAWLVQMDVALAEVVGNGPGTSSPGSSGLVNLVSSIAILLLSHAAENLGWERAPLEPESQLAIKPDTPSPPAAVPAMLEATHLESEIEAGWSRPDLRLSAAQRSALATLQTTLSPDALGPPVPTGPWQGLYLYRDTLRAVVQGKVYDIAWDPLQAQPRIISSLEGEAPGPWLARDEAGRWQLDLRLRLRGGSPLHSRLEQIKLGNVEMLETLDAQLHQDNEYANTQQSYLAKVSRLASPEAPEAILRNYLEKVEHFSLFWERHLERLMQRNERSPLKDYKHLRATALYHHLCNLQSVHVTLQKLYGPKRLQLVEFYKRNAQGYDLTEADERAVKERLDSTVLLIDKFLINSERAREQFDQLKRLASRAQPQISELLQRSLGYWGNPPNPSIWRYQRMETCINRISLIHQPSDEANFWLDRAWANIDLGVAQQIQLNAYRHAGDEALSRLLRSISQQFAAARRQLGNLRDYLDTLPARSDLATLQDDLGYFSREIELELAEYPDAPASSTVQQLRGQLPGLIETAEDGLLIGQPRADDDTLVDILGPEQQLPSRTYRLEQDRWVQVREATADKPAAGVQKLSRLLKDASRTIATARHELDRLQTRNLSSYLPVEIEEVLQHHARQLDLKRNAIEQRLTLDNQTDESRDHLDAATAVKALEDMAQRLTQEALRLRTQAALTQKPRMGELQFLLAKGLVSVRKEGVRRRLAALKGRPADYLDEYVVLHEGKPLWYAHFHYRASDSDRTAFTAGHLKTLEQRYAQGARTGATGLAVEVYRAPITLAAAQTVFFNL